MVEADQGLRQGAHTRLVSQLSTPLGMLLRHNERFPPAGDTIQFIQ
jgi:hypothetical protein